MIIRGEAFFLINLWMNYLSLLLACRLCRGRFPPVRGMLAALAGTVYAFPAAVYGGSWRGWMGLFLSALGMGVIVWGRAGLRLTPMIFAGGLMLSGTVDFLAARGVSSSGALFIAGMGGAASARLLLRTAPWQRRKYRLMILWQGRRLHLPAIRDSGNLMQDHVTGLPVIVAPIGMAKNLLPFPWRGMGDEVPRGCRLLPVKTAAGRRMALCLHPDDIRMIRGRKCWMGDAILALVDFQGPGALLPEALFRENEEGLHAGL